MNIHCNKNLCDNNTGFTHECMFWITEDVIRKAKEENSSMCPTLRKEVMELYNEFAKVITTDIIDKLEEVSFVDIDETYIDDGQRMLFLYDAIEIIKKVGKINETD